MNDTQDTNKFFLETNVQFLRLFGTRRQKDIIEQEIKNSILYSSYFVLREFHIIYTVNLIDFYNMLDNYPTVEEAVKEFINYYSFQSRKYKNLFLVIASEIKSYIHKERAKAKLEIYIREAERVFLEVINHMLNLTDYKILKFKDFENDFFAFYEEINNPQNYLIERFFRLRKEKLLRILNVDTKLLVGMPSDKKNEFKKLIAIYKEIDKDTANADKPSVKAKLGDTIIALESPITCCLLTFDHIYRILCPPLEKAYKILPQPPRTIVPIKS